MKLCVCSYLSGEDILTLMVRLHVSQLGWWSYACVLTQVVRLFVCVCIPTGDESMYVFQFGQWGCVCPNLVKLCECPNLSGEVVCMSLLRWWKYLDSDGQAVYVLTLMIMLCMCPNFGGETVCVCTNSVDESVYVSQFGQWGCVSVPTWLLGLCKCLDSGSEAGEY